MPKERAPKPHRPAEEQTRVRSTARNEHAPRQPENAAEQDGPLAGLQQQVGNRAVQRMLAQRSAGNDAFELDDETAKRINQQRGGGQAPDSAAQQRMADATGYDFSQVRVHTGSEADALNREVGAKAFTTGQDIYFRDGAYDPGSTGGQELLAHEMTHVIQQNSGAAANSSGPMKVNAPGDSFEQEADAVAKAVTSPVEIQRQEESEQLVQAQTEKEEEELPQ